jgi:hypothetical protein
LGSTKRAFCADRGSPLFGLSGIGPDFVTIRVGSLDDPCVFHPTQDISVSSAQTWDHMNPI